MPLVTSGVEYGNLRELCLARMNDLGLKCRDVRTREVGIQDIHHKVKPDQVPEHWGHTNLQVELVRRDYVANGGWETFLAYEDPKQDILIGLLRLRKCSPASFRPELKENTSIVRELHVYGSVVPIHSRDPLKFQHQVRPTKELRLIALGLREVVNGRGRANCKRRTWINKNCSHLGGGNKRLLQETWIRYYIGIYTLIPFQNWMDLTCQRHCKLYNIYNIS